MGIEAPIHVSMKLGDSNSVYNKIVNAAEHPHLSIPETEAARKRNQFQQILIYGLGAFTSSHQNLTHSTISNFEFSHVIVEMLNAVLC